MEKIKKTTTIALCILFLVACNHTPNAGLGAPGSLPYKVAPVYYGKATMVYSFPATIQGVQDVAIIPKVDGFLETIYVDEGNTVKKGQLLFQLRNPQYEEAVRSAKAAVKIAEANVMTAEMNVEQVRPLVDKKIISDYELKSNEFALVASQASLASVKADLANAQVNLGYTTIRSPSDGVLGSIPYDLGSLISSTSGDVLTMVYNTSQVYAYFAINEKQLLNFSEYAKDPVGQDELEMTRNASLKLANGVIYPIQGKVTTNFGGINTKTGSTSFRATFSNPDGLLRSGSSANILIPVLVDSIILIPQDATFDLQGIKMSYKLIKKDSLMETALEVNDITIGNLFIVEKGLQKGDSIVVAGVGSIKPGMHIKPASVNKDSLYSAVDSVNLKIALPLTSDSQTPLKR